MKQLLTLVILGVALVFSSCTVEKRHYTNGYHVEWNHRDKHQVEMNRAASTDPSCMAENKTEADVITPSETSVVLNEEPAAELKTCSETAGVSEQMKNPVQVRTKSEIKASAKAPVRAPFKALNSASAVSATSGIDDVTVNDESSADVDTLLLVIIAFFLPPLAVYLSEGAWNGTCWLNLILTILFWLPGFIHALIVILS